MKTLVAVVVAILPLVGIVQAQDSPKHMNVLAVNGLNMRSNPESNSRVVTKVDYGKQVEILERTKVELKLGWVTENWFKVRYRGREGFIYGGYLSELQAPGTQQAKPLSDLMPMYCSAAFRMQGNPVKTNEVNGTDTLKLQLVKFTNGAELELEQATDKFQAVLILPATMQEAYVLLEALLKSSGYDELLNELRFIRGRDGVLSRVNNADGTISIRPFDEGLTAIRLTEFLAAN